MVGVVVVLGEGADASLEAAKSVRHRGNAKREFERILAAVDLQAAATQ